MKHLFLLQLLVCSGLYALPTYAQNLTCETPETEDLRFKITALARFEGPRLVELTNVSLSAGKESASVASLLPDQHYRPRTNTNRSRFNFPELNATDEQFDGIAHSVILPKELKQADIVAQVGNHIHFKAKVASSTDSYHDGIITYFNLSCLLKVDSEN